MALRRFPIRRALTILAATLRFTTVCTASGDAPEKNLKLLNDKPENWSYKGSGKRSCDRAINKESPGGCKTP